METELRMFIRDMLQPWKLATLFLGMVFLIWGAWYFQIPDWDIPVSFLMAIPTYLTAGWVMRNVSSRNWNQLLPMFLYVWFSVDGVYTIYWSIVNPATLEALRFANAPVSLAMYLAYGLVLMNQGSLKDLFNSLRNTLSNSHVPLN